MFELDDLGIVIEAPSGPWPFGRLINSSPPGTGNGSPAVAEWANDPLMGMYAALAYFGISPSNLQEQVGDSDLVRLLAAVLPIGAFIPVAFSIDPSTLDIRALPCDGAAVSETTYAELFARIGTTWNTGGEPGGTFRVPESRAEFFRGWDNGRGIDIGRAFASAQADALLQHLHTIIHSHGINTYAEASGANVDVEGGAAIGALLGQATTVSQSTNNSGNTGGTENRPRNMAVRFLIRY